MTKKELLRNLECMPDDSRIVIIIEHGNTEDTYCAEQGDIERIELFRFSEFEPTTVLYGNAIHRMSGLDMPHLNIQPGRVCPFGILKDITFSEKL